MNENDFVRKEIFDERTSHLTTAINDTRDRIDDVENSIGHQISFWGILMTVVAVLFAGMQLGLALILYFLTKTPG